ncbi:MAG: polyhydroxyalkanoate synthesis regulator DNA-binding domain-containing protein [Candidatus Zixiibacteriota bacterium]
MKSRVIKRYKNRRLYDTLEKKTIKLEDVANLVKKDVSFEVIDNKNRKDVTISVLARVFSDTLSEDKQNLKQTTKVLRVLISKGGGITMDFFKKSVLFGLGVFDLTREKAEKIVDEMIKRGEMAQSDKAKAVKELLKGHDERMDKLKKKIDESVEKVTAKVKGKDKEELAKLHKKMDELTKIVEKLEKKLGEK